MVFSNFYLNKGLRRFTACPKSVKIHRNFPHHKHPFDVTKNRDVTKIEIRISQYLKIVRT